MGDKLLVGLESGDMECPQIRVTALRKAWVFDVCCCLVFWPRPFVTAIFFNLSEQAWCFFQMCKVQEKRYTGESTCLASSESVWIFQKARDIQEVRKRIP